MTKSPAAPTAGYAVIKDGPYGPAEVYRLMVGGPGPTGFAALTERDAYALCEQWAIDAATDYEHRVVPVSACDYAEGRGGAREVDSPGV